MKSKTIRRLLVTVILTVLFGIAGMIAASGKLTVCIPLGSNPPAEQELTYQWETGQMEIAKAEIIGNSLRLQLKAVQPGNHDLAICNSTGEAIMYGCFRSNRLSIIYDKSTGGFSGCYFMVGALIFFSLSTAWIFFHAFAAAKGSGRYSYIAISAFGLAMFWGLSGLNLLSALCSVALKPDAYSMLTIYNQISGASNTFINLTALIVILYALALIISNFLLIRHEGVSLPNILSILTGLFMLSGLFICLYYTGRDFAGSEKEYRIRVIFSSVICTVFVYFECILFSASVNGLRAAKHKPPYDRDYILILGCRFHPDGSLPPLLRGRADAALSFRNEQIKKTGKHPIMIPSGGRGSDEPFAEAEAIRRYLIGQGVPEDEIIAEDRSATTLENMKFSKEIIDRQNPDAKIAFATTNYHVFRSGLWARLAGLHAEGIGGKTAWWFWPNAFMRECIGLLQKRLIAAIIWLIVLTVFFGLIAMLVPV